jgi:hypothetical protein
MVKDSTKRGAGVAIFIAIIAVAIIVAVVLLGARKFMNIMLIVFIILFVLGVLGAIAYAIWWLFFKTHKFDATYMNAKSLKTAGMMSKPDNIKDLYLSGDKAHSRVRVGRIIGYCRIQIMKKINVLNPETGQQVFEKDPNDPNNQIEKTRIAKEEQDVFILETKGFPMNLFEEEKIIRVRPEDHDDLVGDVTLNGFSLLKISEYFFLNNDYLDVRQIDFSILKEAQRGIFFEHLKDSKEILDKAIGLDSTHKKDIENKNLYEIPQLQGVHQK